MTRRVFPSEGSRLAYGVGSSYLEHRVGASTAFYADDGLTTLADVRVYGAGGSVGSAYAGSAVPVGSTSQFPLWWGPDDDSDTLWYDDGNGTAMPVYAREDDRLDVLEEGLTGVEALVVNAAADPYSVDTTGATDSTTALNVAIADVSTAGGGVVTIPAGATIKALALQLKSNVVLDVRGVTFVKNGGAGDTHLLEAIGTATATTGALTVDAGAGTGNGAEAAVVNMSTADAAKFVAGDFVLLRDATYAFATSGRNQELNRVAASAAFRTVTDGEMTAASATLTSATGAFAEADVGKQVTVAGAGAAGATLTALIVARGSATSVTLATAASTTVSGASVTVSAAVTLATRPLGIYAVASTAELVKITPVTNARVIGGTWQNPAGDINSGGTFMGRLCHNVVLQECRALNFSDDPGFAFEQSANSHFVNCVAQDGQNVSVGGYGYAIMFGESSHHCTAQGCVTENVRESLLSNGVRHCAFVNCTALSPYDDGFNTHGCGVKHGRFVNCTVVGSRGAGFVVSLTTSSAPDVDTVLSGCTAIDCGGAALSIAGASGQEPQRTQVTGFTARNWGLRQASAGILAQRAITTTIRGAHLSGVGNGATRGVQAITCTTFDLLDSTIRDLPNGYGIHWTSVTGLKVEGNAIRNVVANGVLNAADALSTSVLIRSNTSDQTPTASKSLLQGTEIEYGNEWGAPGVALFPSGLDFPTTLPPWTSTAARAAGLANRIYYIRNLLGSGLITKVGFQVTTASGNMRIGIHRNTGTGVSARPSTLKGSTTLQAVPASGYRELALSAATYVAQGEWFSIIIDNTTATLQAADAAATSTLYNGVAHVQDGLTDLPATPAVTGGGVLPFAIVGVP